MYITEHSKAVMSSVHILQMNKNNTPKSITKVYTIATLCYIKIVKFVKKYFNTFNEVLIEHCSDEQRIQILAFIFKEVYNMSETFDYVIVGAGSAGSILANRLTEDGTKSVLVLEAGRSDYPWDLLIQMPAALPFPAGKSLYDWRYETDPEPYMDGRRVKHARGKVLGGSSSINGMIYQRGNPMDYERWGGDDGMENWNFAHCLPYFKRLENTLGAESSDEYRGHDGPFTLERGPAKNPLFKAFFDSAVEAGYSRTPDVNGYRQEGFGPFDKHVHNGRRMSASRAYLRPVMNRKNLTVKTRAFVSSINFDGKKATGLTYTRNGRTHHVTAGEVILSGGAINTPQLLQLSGVGEAEHLRSLGIEPVVNLPGVGENLQDHLEAYIQYACPQPVSEQPNLNKLKMPWIGLQWIFGRKGPAATNHFEGGGFVRSNENVDYPNLMFHFLPLAVRYDGQKAEAKHGFQVHVGLCTLMRVDPSKFVPLIQKNIRVWCTTIFQLNKIVVSGWKPYELHGRLCHSLLWLHIIQVKFLLVLKFKQMMKYWIG